MLLFLCFYFLDSFTALIMIDPLTSKRTGYFNKTLSQLAAVMIINRLVITYLKDNSLIRGHPSLYCVRIKKKKSSLSIPAGNPATNCISVLLIESRVIFQSLGDDEETLQQHKALLRCFEQLRHCH